MLAAPMAQESLSIPRRYSALTNSAPGARMRAGLDSRRRSAISILLNTSMIVFRSAPSR